MSTTLSLDSALSGLKAAQRTLDTISNNIANAQTAGFTRKILPQETLVVGGVGMGVQLGAVMRSVDMSLLRDLMKQASFSAGATLDVSRISTARPMRNALSRPRSASWRMLSRPCPPRPTIRLRSPPRSTAHSRWRTASTISPSF